MSSRTFISYESSDREIAFIICEYLESQGFPCWIAPRDIRAGEYAGEITRALKSADTLVVVCSKATSNSAHVRNEVSLAFENRCRIVPFCVERVKLDDSLEYYFAGKQRVYADGNPDLGMKNLLAVLSGKPLQPDSITGHASHGHRAWLLCIPLVLAISFFAIRHFVPHTFADDEVDTTSMSVASDADERPASETPSVILPPEKAPQVKDGSDTFTGTLKDGYPDGIGVYTFSEGRRIDMHDESARMAEKGDYIEGEWSRGHLLHGIWYASDGSEKGMIYIGECMNPEADHCFGRCARR